jgi:uncharacterized protein
MMETIEVFPGVELLDLAIYLRPENILVMGDVHLGYEQALARRGVLIPRFQLKDTVERLEKIFKVFDKFEAIVINGDLKHEFAVISEQEWREILKFFDFLLLHSKQIMIIRGNHDVKLIPIARKRNISVVESLATNGKFICHGDVVPKSLDFNDSKIVIAGNEHPAVSLHEGQRSELYKCFLIGTWKGKKLIVMPSFNQITVGSDILREKSLSPFMKQDLSNFEVYIIGDKVYPFGKFKNLPD